MQEGKGCTCIKTRIHGGLALGQVGTTDGRIKVFGQEGVECMFRSPGQCPTRHLRFLDGRGALLRVTNVCPRPEQLCACCHAFPIHNVGMAMFNSAGRMNFR